MSTPWDRAASVPWITRKVGFPSHFALAYGKSGIASDVLYYVCVATTYSQLFDREISQIIRFFETQNQSNLFLNKNILILSSYGRSCVKRYGFVLAAIAILVDLDTNMVIVCPCLGSQRLWTHSGVRLAKTISGTLHKPLEPWSALVLRRRPQKNSPIRELLFV